MCVRIIDTILVLPVLPHPSVFSNTCRCAGSDGQKEALFACWCWILQGGTSGLSLYVTKSLLEITKSQDSSRDPTPLLRQGYLQLFAHDHVEVASENTSKEGDPPASLGKLCQCLAVLPVGEVLQSLHHTREPTAGHSTTTTTTTQKRISNFCNPLLLISMWDESCCVLPIASLTRCQLAVRQKENLIKDVALFFWGVVWLGLA